MVKIDESRGYHFLEARTCVENGNIVNVICVESQAYIRRNHLQKEYLFLNMTES